jgi:hypothetical protein
MCENSPNQESMLWSQFYAIFANFRRKNGVFLKKTTVIIKFLHNLALFWVKTPIFLAKVFQKS